MLAKVHSAAVLGIDAYPIEIEVNSGWDNRRSSLLVFPTLLSKNPVIG
jgi:hypothetical protein